MNLLDYNPETESITVSPEAYILGPIKDLWESRKDKNIAAKELGYIFFMVNKTNELRFWQKTDEEERSKEVIKYIFGKSSKWTPDVKVIKAKEFYEKETKTFAEDYLDAVMHGATKTMEYLYGVDWDMKDKSGKFIYDINKIKSSLTEAPDIIEAVDKVRNKVFEQQQSKNDKRGQHNVGMFENGNNLV